MAVFTLTLVRHGETNCNKERITQGQLDTELSEKGILQAKLAGERLAFEQFTRVYSSDLKRAMKTCETILSESKVSVPSIRTEQKLRERNFGVQQGRPASEFLAAVRRERKTVSTFVPDGGESIQELRSRAVSFFEDLCHDMRQLLLDKDNNCLEMGTSPLSGSMVKRRRHTSATADVFPSPESPVSDCLLDTQISNNGAAASQKGHKNSGSSSSTSGCSSLTAGDVSEQTLGELSPGLDLATSPATSLNLDADDNPVAQGSSLFTQPLFDLEIKTNITPPKTIPYGCPNVSLSPIFSGSRINSISSISSGRNNSFDEGDLVPALLADVLVVTHGGLLRELISHFVERLSCKIPGTSGDNRIPQHVSPNTGISKFTVTISESPAEPVRVTCLTFHDKDHLLQAEKGLGDDVVPLSKTDEV